MSFIHSPKHPYLGVRMFSAKVREDIPLSIAMSHFGHYTTVHATGCADLAKADDFSDEFDVEKAMKYADDYYKVAPCAKEREWTKAERANRPDW